MTFISTHIDPVVVYSSVLSIFVTSVSSMSCLLCERLVLVVNGTLMLKSNIVLFEKRCAPQFFGAKSGICVGTSYTCVLTPFFSIASGEKCSMSLLHSIFSKEQMALRDCLDLSKSENLIYFLQILFERHDVSIHFHEHSKICS